MSSAISSAAMMSAMTMTTTVMRDMAGFAGDGWLARDCSTGGAGGASGGVVNRCSRLGEGADLRWNGARSIPQNRRPERC